jgi:Fic family protein
MESTLTGNVSINSKEIDIYCIQVHSINAMDPKSPHDELPLIPPQEIETTAVLRKLTSTARALAKLDAASQSLPDPTILINTIPLQEAQASSAIENIVTTQDALYQADVLQTEPVDLATREALRYRSALREATQALDLNGYSNEILVRTCSQIKGATTGFRGGVDFVHLKNGAGSVVYTPPANAVVLPKLLTNQEDYISNDDADSLLKMAVAHYQFEAIHPFPDGNGRTGRVLNLLVLQAGGLLHLPVLYLSKYIIERKDAYYELLLNVTRKGDWEAWILWLLDGVEVTSLETVDRIQRVAELKRLTMERIQREAPELDKTGLMEALFRQPYCKIQFLVDAGVAKRQTASKYLQQLEGLGILRGVKVGREVIYLHGALVEALR